LKYYQQNSEVFQRERCRSPEKRSSSSPDRDIGTQEQSIVGNDVFYVF